VRTALIYPHYTRVIHTCKWCKTPAAKRYAGIGKTEICRKLFHEAINGGLPEVSKAGWVTFGGGLAQSFFRQFDEIDYPADNAADYLSQAERYIDGLLLFVDNANDISREDTSRLLKLGCKIILTSRNEAIERMKPIEVERLDIKDCRILYRYHSKTGKADSDSYPAGCCL